MESQSVMELSETKKILESDIKRLKDTRDNLESQVLGLEIRKERLDKSQGAQDQAKINKVIVELNETRGKLGAQMSSLEEREARYRERMIVLERREADLINLNKKMKELHEERLAIYRLRDDASKIMEKAKITMAEANETLKAIDLEKHDLSLRETQIAKREEEWNNRIGALEKREKQLGAFEKDLISLQAELKEKEKRNEARPEEAAKS